MIFKKGDIIENQLWKNLVVDCMDGDENVWVFYKNEVRLRFHTSWMKLIKRSKNESKRLSKEIQSH